MLIDTNVKPSASAAAAPSPSVVCSPQAIPFFSQASRIALVAWANSGVAQPAAGVSLPQPEFHGTWVCEADLDIIARHGVCICHNASSNLRLRSGIAPVKQFVARELRRKKR